MNTIINVGRQFGSGGGYVAQAVGRKLGIPVYDNELISKAAEESGYSKSVFEGGEKRKSLFSMSSFFASGRLPFGESSGYINDDMLFKIQSDVIRNIAEKGNAIIVGRCADYILRDLDCLDVFVCAPMEFRVQRLVKNEGLDPEEAEELMRLAGFSFSPSDPSDLVVMFCIEKEIWDLASVNYLMASFDIRDLEGVEPGSMM